MSWIATAFTAASTIVQVSGQIYAGKQQKAVADYNAQVQRDQADLEAAEQLERVKRIRKQNKAILARGIATRAAGGPEVAEGSSLMVDADNAMELELKALDSSRDSDNRQRKLRAGARITEIEGKAAKTTSYYQAGASLLRGGSQIAKLFV
jgi:hypothetical protein